MRLVQGMGREESGTGCWMTALHYYTRQERDDSWTDRAPSAKVSPVVRQACIRANDHCNSDEEREKLIGPHMFDPVGTDTGPLDDAKRIAMLREACGSNEGFAAAVTNSTIIEADRAAQTGHMEIAAIGYASAVAIRKGPAFLIELIAEMCKVGAKVEVAATKTKEEVMALKPKAASEIAPFPTMQAKPTAYPGCSCFLCTGKKDPNGHAPTGFYMEPRYWHIDYAGLNGKPVKV